MRLQFNITNLVKRSASNQNLISKINFPTIAKLSDNDSLTDQATGIANLATSKFAFQMIFFLIFYYLVSYFIIIIV